MKNAHITQLNLAGSFKKSTWKARFFSGFAGFVAQVTIDTAGSTVGSRTQLTQVT